MHEVWLPVAVPADPSPAGPGTYEDVAGGSQTSGLGKSDKAQVSETLQL